MDPVVRRNYDYKSQPRNTLYYQVPLPTSDQTNTGHMESIIRQRWPEEGDIVVIQIDPVMSVAPLDSRQATYWAKGMKTEKYVAFITKSSMYHTDNEGWVHDLHFGLIGQGLPWSTRKHRDELNEIWMCIPIEPTTSHPLNRKPVKVAGGELPWTDCYYHTAHMQPQSFEANEIHAADGTPDIFVPAYETWRVEGIAHADHEKYLDLLHEEQQQLLQTRGKVEEPVSFCIPESTLDRIASVRPPPQPLKVVVDIWYDLSVVSRVNNPEAFFDEVYSLAREEHRAFERWENVLLEEPEEELEDSESEEDYSDTEYSQETVEELEEPELKSMSHNLMVFLSGHVHPVFDFSRSVQLLWTALDVFLQIFKAGFRTFAFW